MNTPANHQTDEARRTTFSISGTLEVAPDLIARADWEGTICGYQLPDGRTVRLAMALEIESTDGEFSYVNSDVDMARCGFTCLDYEKISFIQEGGNSD